MSPDVLGPQDNPGLAGGNRTADQRTYEEFVVLVRKSSRATRVEWKHLYQLLSQGIRFFLMRRLKSPDVEDKVHEVFVDVVCAIRRQSMRDPTRLMGFVRTVIHRKVAKQIGHLVRSRGEHAD